MFLLPLGLDQMKVQGIPRFSLGIAVLCVVVFLGLLPMGEEAFAAFGTIPAEGLFQLGMFTSLFVHAGVLHLLGNLLFLYLAGPVVEDVWGAGLFLVLYFVGGFIADWGQIALDPSSTIPVVGASGAIAACIGALCVQFPNRRVRMFYWVLIIYRGTFFVPVWLWGGIWLLSEIYDLAMSGGAGGIAFGAHIAGFLFGAGMAYAVVKVRGAQPEHHIAPLHDVPLPQARATPLPEPLEAPVLYSTEASVQPTASEAPTAASTPSSPPDRPSAAREQGPPRAFPKAPKLREPSA